MSGPSPTTDVHTAIRRLAPLVDKVVILKSPGERGRYLVSTNPDPHDLGAASKRSMETLAFLADLAPPGAKDRVRWVGQVPANGLAAWEVASLVSLGGALRL